MAASTFACTSSGLSGQRFAIPRCSAPRALPASAPCAQARQRGEGLARRYTASATLVEVLVGSGLAACSTKWRRARRVARRVVSTVPTVEGLMIKPDECENLIGESRAAHWVIRTSNLQVTLKFLSEVFDMKVLRHEEFDDPCAITCNGAYKTPWSKTMVGYGPEDKHYCLELTYNYGISSYQAGTGLAHVAVGVDNTDTALTAAANLGYGVDGDLITGPDGYNFRVVAQQPEREERFQYVALRVGNESKAADFYRDALGMKELPLDSVHTAFAAGSRLLGYSHAQVPLLLFKDQTVPEVRLEQWEGRNAIAVPGRAMRAVYQRILEHGHGGGILHPIREFNEFPALRRMRGLPPMPCEPAPDVALRALRENPASAPSMGTLAVAIATDADGYEICLVSSETYNLAVARAYNPDTEIDWAWRDDAEAGKRTPAPYHMVACV